MDIKHHYPKYNDRTSLKSLLLEACSQGKINIAKFLIEVRHVSPLLKMYISEPEGQETFTYETLNRALCSENKKLMQYIGEKCGVEVTFHRKMWY